MPKYELDPRVPREIFPILHRARLDAGLTLDQVAKNMPVTTARLEVLERGNVSHISLEKVLHWANAVGGKVEISWNMD